MEYFFYGIEVESYRFGDTTMGLQSGTRVLYFLDRAVRSGSGRDEKDSVFIDRLKQIDELSGFKQTGVIQLRNMALWAREIWVDIIQNMENSLKVIQTEISEQLLSQFILTKTKIGSDQKIIPSLMNCSLSYTQSSLPSNNRIAPQPSCSSTCQPPSLLAPFPTIDSNLATTKKRLPTKFSPRKSPRSSSRSPVKSLAKPRAKQHLQLPYTPSDNPAYGTLEMRRRNRTNTIEKNLKEDKTLVYFNRVYNLGRTFSIRRQKSTVKGIGNRGGSKGKNTTGNCRNSSVTTKRTLKLEHLDFNNLHSDIYKEMQTSWRTSVRKSQTEKSSKKPKNTKFSF